MPKWGRLFGAFLFLKVSLLIITDNQAAIPCHQQKKDYKRVTTKSLMNDNGEKFHATA
jgi:hypothetical protein